MEDLKRSAKSEDDLAIRDQPELLRLPTPAEPLRQWTEQDIGPKVMIDAMETMIQIARSQPDFEAQRRARKRTEKFKY